MINIYSKDFDLVYPNQVYPAQAYPKSKYLLHEELFEHNGLGVLKDFTSNPQITEVLNGEYTLEFEYSKNGWLNEYLIEENIIKANGQLFRIYFTDKTLKNIKVLAKHIVFDLNNNFVEDVAPTLKNAEDALNWVLTRTQYINGYTATSDITDEKTARYVRKNINEVLYTADNSIINVWGGEFEFDNFTIKLWEQRGSNNNLQIRYGKNLTGIQVKTDFSETATRIMPKGANGLLLPEKYIDSELINNYHAPIIKMIDMNYGVTEETTEDQALQLMRDEVAFLFANGIDKPVVSVKVDFIELSKVKEYESYSALESVNLGDTVKVYIEELNLDVNLRVKKTIYDCLLNRNVKLELGEITTNYVNSNRALQTNTEKKIDERVKTSEIISKINESEETVTINAEKLQLIASNIDLTADDIQITSTNFNVTSSGVLTATNANLSGSVTSASGAIGGFNLGSTSLTASNVGVSTGTYAFWAGDNTASNAEFRVTNAGSLTATSATITGTVTSSSGSIGGWALNANYLYSTSANVTSYIYKNGAVIFGGDYGLIKFDTNPVRITTASKMLISDSYSEDAMASANDTISVRAFNGTVHINSNYGVYANSTLLASGSSRNMKENIKELTKKDVNEIYNEIKNLKSYKYDYKDKYADGQKNNYGFIIEDFEDKKLGEILHVVGGEDETKYYSHEDLTRINTILIQEIMKKLESKQ